MTDFFAYYDGQDTIQLNRQLQHQKMFVLCRHESVRCVTSIFIMTPKLLCDKLLQAQYFSARAFLKKRYQRYYNVLCDRFSLYKHAANLCNTRTDEAKCTELNCLNARWQTFKYCEVCLIGSGTSYWRPNNLTPFSISVVIVILQPHSYGFLVF